MNRKDLKVRVFAEVLALSVAAGLCGPSAAVFAAGGNDLVITEEAAGQEKADAAENSQYVLMNIPYDDFYKAEVKNNTIPVDAFTSATLNKTRTNSSAMAEGSYHADPNGSDITGITYPVKVGEGVDLSKYHQVKPEDSVSITVTNRGQTSTSTYTGADALFENESYSYYLLDDSEIPQNYKEVTVQADGTLSFGAAQGERTTKTGVMPELLTETSYGDYQLNLDGLDLEGEKVHGVVVETDEAGYGLRHLENIWRQTNLSWCAGFTQSVHNCPTSSVHYQGMMGQTIKKVIYYTSKGIYEIPMEEYVPVKFGNYTLNVANAPAASSSTTLELSGLPSDYEAQYSAEGLQIEVAGNSLSFAAASKGEYTFTVKDAKGHYAPLQTTFELYVEDMPAAYDSVNKTLTAAEGFGESDFFDYLANITSVEVDGKNYSASGHGSVKIISDNGILVTDAEPLADKESAQLSVSSTGYLPFTFTYTKVPEPTATPEPENPEPARPKKGTVSVYNKVQYRVTGSNTVTALKANTKTLTAAKIPATITIDGYRFKVTAIFNQAFANCKKLKSMEIGSNVASIGKKAFFGDTNLASISVKTSKLTKAKVGANAFKNIKSTCTLKVPSKKTAAYKAIFQAKGAGKKIRVKNL